VLIEGTAEDGDPPVTPFEAMVAKGSALIAQDGDAAARYRTACAAIPRDALASIVYTSGTTGEPKGVMLTHANIMSNVLASAEVLAASPEDVALTFLPLSHVYERMVLYRYLWTGMSVWFAESLNTVARDLARVRPTIMAAVPRVFEKVHSTIQEKVAQGPAIRRALFRWGIGVGGRCARARLEGRRPALADRLQLPVADRLVLAKVRERLGGRFRFIASGSAPLARHVAEFFFALGVTIVEGYGLTETSPVLSTNPLDRVKIGTVGPPLPGVELRIGDHGEILARGPNVMAGYYKRPDLTAEVLKDGWFHTGDIGEIDQDGYLTITDRKKDLIVTSGGKKIAPQPLENTLKADPLVAEAVIIGEQRRFPAVLIVPDFAALAARAETLGLGGLSRDQLLRHPSVQALYQEALDRLNTRLAQFERIKRFALLPSEFTMERGELTPTMKVRRKVVEDRWKNLIDDLYEHRVAAQV
jgi:long-chain acyl-CoA synthetase